MKPVWLVVFLMGMLIALPMVAVAGNYGAIAYDKSTGRWGYSHNYGSRGEAERSAVVRCGSPGCVAYNWFRMLAARWLRQKMAISDGRGATAEARRKLRQRRDVKKQVMVSPVRLFVGLAPPDNENVFDKEQRSLDEE